ncbi:DUF6515 family protein [Desulfocurvus vexinensis]|uniref:DUF6515 family protein n=1 Tax=Desulfocurvus vexinensis TaxID=399548 RepID=UPI0004B00551|nr:DUF6515 family protein [Desulfocurvus vexinensis]
MQKKNKIFGYTALTLALLATLHAPAALAQPGGHARGGPAPQHHPGPGGGARGFVPALPAAAVTILFAGLTYAFVDGLFYLPGSGGFAVVTPPVGLVIPVLPPGCTVVMVGPRTYYRAQGVYYVRAAEGYAVVQPPAQAAPAPAQQAPALPSSVTVVLENANGSRTPVTLTRTADGWLGPKGELYDAIPTQEQLRPYYGLAAQAPGQTL